MSRKYATKARLTCRFSCTVWLLALTLLLTGCNSAERLFDDYLARLQRTLDVPVPEAIDLSLPAYPKKRNLFIAIPDTRINLLEAWELNHCELFALIGERNSILGKLSEPDIRFDYEWRLLQALPACITDPQTSADNQTLLTQILEDKQRQLPAMLWNATFAHDDFTHLFSLSERLLRTDEPLDIPAYEDALWSLRRLTQTNAAGTPAELLNTNRLTSQFALVGSVLKSQRLSITRLTQANAMLAQATETQTLCPEGLTLKELDIARNILVNIFIGRIQPWLVTVSEGYRAGTEQSRQLLHAIPTDQQTRLTAYFEQTAELDRRYTQTIRDHTQQWQQLFERCAQSATPQSKD